MMKKTMMMALLAAFAVGTQAGCVFVSEDDDGDFLVQWTFLPVTANCQNLGAATVSVRSTDSFGTAYDDHFDCYAGSGYTAQLPEDDYRVGVDLFTAGGASLLRSTVVLFGQRIFGGETTVLPTFEFDFR